MIEITRPDGSIVHMNPTSFAQFYYEDHRTPQSGTRIDLSGGIQITPERAEDLAARLHGLIRLVMLHIPPLAPAPTFPIWINVSSIRAVRDTPPGTTLTVTRAPFKVTEDFTTVMRIINAASNPSPLNARLSATIATMAIESATPARPATSKPKTNKAKAKKAKKAQAKKRQRQPW